MSAVASSSVTSIQCKSCAAPLELKGGHRVRSITCSYCGAVMDAHAEFEVLAKYENLERPYSPLAIGMEGEIKGVRFTVIGTVGYESRDHWGIYPWVSHQIFSPTHGYAWLTYNERHFIFSRRVRELPEPRSLPQFVRKKTIEFRGTDFKMFETYDARITFVEGELTWIAGLDDRVKIIEAIAPPLAFEYERTSNELEYSLSEYVPRAAVEAGFAIELEDKRPMTVHPAQPFIEGPFLKGWRQSGWIAAIISACAILMIYIAGQGLVVLDQRVKVPRAGIPAMSFEVTATNQLLALEMHSPVNNSWVYYEVEITDAEGEPVLALGSEISYYHGYDDGSWSEGSQTATTLFRLPAPGEYGLEIEIDPQSSSALPLHVQVREGAMPLRYFVGLFVLSIIGAVLPTIYRFLMERKRWGEDDD